MASIPTAVFAIILLFYLCTFILCAIIRFATGISIQRLGWFSIRRVVWTPKDGYQVAARAVALSIHWPSFAQPTAVTIQLKGATLTVDPNVSKPPGRSRKAKEDEDVTTSYEEAADASEYPDSQSETDSIASGHGPRSKAWEQLKAAKTWIKRLHQKIYWFTWVDVHATDAKIRYVGAGDISIGTATLSVDTRRTVIENAKLFRHKKGASGEQEPVEWTLNMRNVFLALEGREGIELLDDFSLNIHGLVKKKKVDGLRDVSVSVKAGRFHVPYDDLMAFVHKAKEIDRRAKKDRAHDEQDPELSFAAIVEELDRPGSREESIVQKVADFREITGSLLRGVQELQLAISFFRVSRMVQPAILAKKPLYLNVVTHEVGVDVHRMDPSRPAHRMYFQRDDIAHQALLAAISLSVSLSEDANDYGKILYIPMATTTIKTTLPSKTVAYSENPDAAERNTNVLFANFVVTSPSVDLEPKQLSNILSLLQGRRPPPRGKKRDNHLLISRLLPKATIKLSVHEPVLRFVLPRAHDEDQHDYDMLVSSISSLSLDIESSHSAEAGVQYSLAAVYRVASHQLYYQTVAGLKHRLLATETMEIKVHLNATDQVCVVGTGSLNTFSLHLVSAEVTRGVHQVVEQFYNHAQPTKLPSSRDRHNHSFLRRLPPWLLQFHFETHGFSLEIAGVDDSIGPNTRGMVIQLQSWTADYQASRPEPRQRYARRRTPSHSAISEDPSFRFASSSPSRRPYRGPADGRRLALHGRGLEGFVMESADYMEQESFLSVPRLEVALTTSSDLQGPVFHINSVIHEILFKHSLYRYYAIGIAVCALHDAFAHSSPKHRPSPDVPEYSPISPISDSPLSPSTRPELVTIDIKTHLVQVKCAMPLDPPMLLQVYGLVAGRHRWSAPFMRCALVRLHAEAPKTKGAWARIVSVNNVRVGLRESIQRQAHSIRDAKCIDLATDFIRLSVPHQMVMHRIFDNFVNTTKAIQQLNHRFKTRSNEYVLEKHPEGPKKVPRISLRTKALLFELEDDAFEWKLGSIFRLGLLEQRQRLAREEAHMMKIKKVDESRRRNAASRQRGRSRKPVPTRTTNQTGPNDDSEPGTPPVSARARVKSPTRARRNSCSFRYNTEKAREFSDKCDLPREHAWYRLQQLNARSWKERITSSIRAQNTAIKDIRNLFLGADEPPDGEEAGENILGIPNRPGLLAALISDLHLTLDKPSFPVEQYADFLHKLGKGMPMDMKYSLLIPMSIRLEMGEARAHLRDYPLDLIHVPALRPGQSHKLPSWSLSTDFVIAEEYRSVQSSRHVVVNIVPPSKGPDGVSHPGFSIDVRRTVSPTKTYSNPRIEVHTSLPTTLSWGMSYQPVIQDMMKIIEGFTKPEVDPSERVGFWDKIRLNFHSRMNVVWKGDGDVHLRLKGSRDPYVVTSYGAGFVMCFRKDVQWEIHSTDDPKEFMKVTSGEYVLAVPDYSHQARHSYESSSFDSYSSSSKTSSRDSAMFKKVIMKLYGNVRWLVGLVFERNSPDGQRSFEFKPHYDVVLRNPKFLDLKKHPDYDAFRGFRSNHIHLSLAIEAPASRVWSFSNLQPSTNYNSVHLTPRFFTHFFAWWSLFSGVMSLPVRQGKLFPGITKTSKKLSRHLGTVKYNLFLSPLFVSHIYKHKDQEDYGKDVVVSTGLKVRLDSFMLDLHQRREQVLPVVRGRSKQTKASTMRINRAQLDFISADCRAVSASIGGTNPEDLEKADDDILSSFQQPVPPVDLSRFTIPDQDFNWIDMDDFVELDWILPSESNPKTQILPLAYSPRFSYFRQTDYEEVGPDEPGYSPFGDEPTHHCVMSASQDNDPRRVQMELIRERLQTLQSQIESHASVVGEHQLQFVCEGGFDDAARSHHELLLRQGETLEKRKAFLESGLRRLEKLLAENENGSFRTRKSDNSSPESGSFTESEFSNADPEIGGLYASSSDEFISDFNNRFIIHNLQGKWNNSLRNIILRYIHQVSQRRGFVYYMSRRAVKFILDIVEDQGKSKMRGKRHSTTSMFSEGPGESDDDDGMSVQERIEQLLSDAKQFVHADESDGRPSGESTSRGANRPDDIAPEFTAQNGYHLRLIGPQIQFQSEKNKKSVALLTAKGMQLKVVSILDNHRVADDISGLVQRQFKLDMDCAQFFVAQQKTFSNHPHIYGGNSYGNAPGAVWPPWVSLESMFDFELDTFGFSRIIQKTSASLRYDKFNSLRLKYNEKIASGDGEQPHTQVANENRIDSISVEFSHVRAICDSTQYYAMYIIVLDLLLYSEPLEKVRSERLEKLMLASDFSDLRGAPEMVSRLQQRIRHLEEIKNLFQIQAKYLDKQGWKDRMILERDLTACEDELFFIMKAITTSQRKNEERAKSQSSGLLRWTLSASEIVWHLMKDFNQPLVEFQLRNASYERTDNIDGSNNNTIAVQRISGLNLLPSAVYPQMIVPYLDQKHAPQSSAHDNMLKVDWYMLEAISGIPVVKSFEVALFPLKVQLERELGKKLFEYIFPGIGSNAFENGGFSPFIVKQMPVDEDSDSGDESDDRASATTSTENDSSAQTILESRLHPTLSLPEKRKSDGSSLKGKELTMTPMERESGRRLFRSRRDRSRSESRHPIVKKKSTDSLRFIGRQATDKGVPNGQLNGDAESEDKPKRFVLRKAAGKTDKLSDDISQMMSRASNYVILTDVKINDVVLCLSYKGKGDRNLEDIHDFVFRMPVLEYRNKVWSNLDLALRLKKDAIKALISHAPAILSNKFSHHRPSKQQQKRLRELATSSQVLSVADSMHNWHPSRPASETTSSLGSRSSTERSESPRRSFNSAASPLSVSRPRSAASSLRSSAQSQSSLAPPNARSVDERTNEDDEDDVNFRAWSVLSSS